MQKSVTEADFALAEAKNRACLNTAQVDNN
jgi:hypothetical protein